MKKVFLILMVLFAYTGIKAQCNLTVTNNTAVAIEFIAAEANAYDCNATVDGINGLTVAASGSTNVSHNLHNNWVGIHLTQIGGTAVSEAFPNNLAANCPAGSGTFTVTWVSACAVVIQ